MCYAIIIIMIIINYIISRARANGAGLPNVSFDNVSLVVFVFACVHVSVSMFVYYMRADRARAEGATWPSSRVSHEKHASLAGERSIAHMRAETDRK